MFYGCYKTINNIFRRFISVSTAFLQIWFFKVINNIFFIRKETGIFFIKKSFNFFRNTKYFNNSSTQLINIRLMKLLCTYLGNVIFVNDILKNRIGKDLHNFFLNPLKGIAVNSLNCINNLSPLNKTFII